MVLTLPGDFRGTKSSLRRLIDDTRFQQPLIRDIYQYYRAERLYLLQAVKEVLVRADAPAHANSAVFADTVRVLSTASSGHTDTSSF